MKDKTAIAIVGPSPPPAGGMATQTAQLCRLLREEGLDVRLVRTNPPYKPHFIRNVRGVRAAFRLIGYTRRVWRVAGEVGVIHLMANSGWSWQLFAAPVLWIGRIRKTPVIVNYRGGHAGEYFRQSFNRVRPSLHNAAKIVVPSGYLREIFSSYGVETRVIPNIVNVDRFKPVETSTHNGEFTIVITRNLEPIYGIDTALEAVALARDEIPGLRLLIAGTGPQKRELDASVERLGLAGTIRFLGQLDPDQIAALYQGADMLLNPSTVDNMPNSLLEAMACGVPIVTTDVGGIPFIVENGETALMVPKDSPRALASNIVRLFREPGTRRRLRDNGLRAVQNYAWPVVKRQWLDLYREIGAVG